ncbi:MAG: hypothetical protein PHU23_04915 [Dehalococcoidales bacterium]|nr:hypothetical protein [Dehalococcoidales bacterium]
MTKPVNYRINSVTGLEGEPGVFYDYILAADGVYLRAKNDLLSVTMNIARQEVRGLAPLQEEIFLCHGKIPLHLLSLALSILCVNPDIEHYIAITWEGEYRIRETVLDAGSAHVNYENLDNTILDLHSHTGSMPAQFSSIDDFDERGFRFYAVAGDLRSLFPTVEMRLGVYGYYLPVEKSELFV